MYLLAIFKRRECNGEIKARFCVRIGFLDSRDCRAVCEVVLVQIKTMYKRM